MSKIRPDDEDEKAMEVLAKQDSLSPWETEFLESLAATTHWSAKQGACFDEVWEKIMTGRGG